MRPTTKIHLVSTGRPRRVMNAGGQRDEVGLQPTPLDLHPGNLVLSKEQGCPLEAQS